MAKNVDNRYGKWTVLKEVGTAKPGRHFECLCDCGTVSVIPATTLRAGRSTQCLSCMYRERDDPYQWIGKDIGQWTVVSVTSVKRRFWHVMARCSCGVEKEQCLSDLKKGRSQRCSTCSNRLKAANNVTHGMNRSPIYKVWHSMRQRCHNPKASSYKWYGSRGIKVCERWHIFENFLADMGERPDGMTIDRINNAGDYEPGNCRWVSHFVNCQNRRVRGATPEL